MRQEWHDSVVTKFVSFKQTKPELIVTIKGEKCFIEIPLHVYLL